MKVFNGSATGESILDIVGLLAMLIASSNELNAAYAADGFARVAQSANSRSIGVVTTTLVLHVKY